jgi:hypothetical protein
MTNKSSIISFGVESQLEITNINIRKYPDDEVQNILFSVMDPNKMSNYQPLSSTNKFITDPSFFKHRDVSCQTNYIDFTSDKCEQVVKEHLIIPCDIMMQTDEIPQPKPPETINMCVQTDTNEVITTIMETCETQTDIVVETIKISEEDSHKELPLPELESCHIRESESPLASLESNVTKSDAIEFFASSVNTGLFNGVECTTDSSRQICTDTECVPTINEDIEHQNTTSVGIVDSTDCTNVQSVDIDTTVPEEFELRETKDDQTCNFSVENLFTNTCYNKHTDKNIIVLNTYEEHSHRNVIIDNSRHVCNINLYNGQEMEQKDFYLINPSAYHATINTTRGSFCIDSHTSHKKLFYSDKWIVLDTTHNNLFPTHVNTKIQHESTLQSIGSSVSVDGLGNICVIGNITAHESIGSVYIYSYVNNNWSMTEELICKDNINQSFFGSSVSIDYSGHVIAVGGSGDNNGIGACWIYSKQLEDSQWSCVKKLIGYENIGKSHQGINVHLTPDGKKLFVCGVGCDNYSGAVWVFSCVDNDWVESQKIFVPNSKRFGTSISTDHTGSCVVIGSIDNIYVFNFKEKYELTTSLFKSDTVKCVGMNQNCSSVIATILQHGKNTDMYIIEHDKKNNWYASHKLFEECLIKFYEIYSCCSSVNGETIIVSGIDENKNSVSWCFVKINDKWVMINKQILAETITHEIVSAMSAFGHTTIIGLPQIDNYNGECIILY